MAPLDKQAAATVQPLHTMLNALDTQCKPLNTALGTRTYMSHQAGVEQAMQGVCMFHCAGM